MLTLSFFLTKQQTLCLKSYSLESVLDNIGSEKYGCEVIAT